MAEVYIAPLTRLWLPHDDAHTCPAVLPLYRFRAYPYGLRCLWVALTRHVYDRRLYWDYLPAADNDTMVRA